MEYYVIGDEDTVLGFSLVGLSGSAVSSESEARSAWEKVLEKRKHTTHMLSGHPIDGTHFNVPPSSSPRHR